MAAKLLPLAFVALMLAGCSQQADPPQNGGGDASPSGDSTGVTNGTLPAAIPAEIAWNECHGIGATMSYYGNVINVDQGKTPPGWEPDATEDNRYYFMVNRCERVSIGSFERGPIHFLLEAHGGVEPPPACLEFDDEPNDVKVLLGLWVDDQELAAFLRDTYGMPAQVGTMQLDVTPQGDAETHQWTWELEGSEASTLVGIHPGGMEGASTYLDRLVWNNGVGVTMLDFHEDSVLPYQPFPTAQGILAPPMAYGEGTARPFAGLASVWKESDHYGPIARFGDFECENLLA